MNKIEERLKKLPLASVPNGLNQRVDKTIRAHGTRRAGLVSMPVPMWACATACFVFLVTGLWLARMVGMPASGPRTSTTWFVEASPAFSATFANEKIPTDYFQRKKHLVN